MKRQLTALLLGLLLVSAAGCTTKDKNDSSLPSEPAGASEPAKEVKKEADVYTVEDENVSVEIKLDDKQYDLETVIPLVVEITNKSDETVAFIQGSGSNLVPDGLKVKFGGFAGMFYPEITTMDYRTQFLEPGETVSFDLPYAPYIYQGTEEKSAFGTDKDLDFFKGKDFRPAEPGVVEGTLEFTYSLQPQESSEAPEIELSLDSSELLKEVDPASLPDALPGGDAGTIPLLEDAQQITIKGTFRTTIVAE
ncbi:hypothetical protein U6B65_04035 [Oscillospiraceae bacterium MB08-C2-2]|nr:hypothetical protein U6B65_04035 [Oscillospiraceae bacterium MB08-C2-2]